MAKPLLYEKAWDFLEQNEDGKSSVGLPVSLEFLQQTGRKENVVGWTPVHQCANNMHQSSGGRRLLEAVVEAAKLQGALNMQTPKGLTPLHLAAGVGNTFAVAVLLHAGADTTLTALNGDTPAQRARSSAEIRKMLKAIETGQPLGKPTSFLPRGRPTRRPQDWKDHPGGRLLQTTSVWELDIKSRAECQGKRRAARCTAGYDEGRYSPMWGKGKGAQSSAPTRPLASGRTPVQRGVRAR